MVQIDGKRRKDEVQACLPSFDVTFFNYVFMQDKILITELNDLAMYHTKSVHTRSIVCCHDEYIIIYLYK